MLRCVVVFLIFVLIVSLPIVAVLASNGSQPSSSSLSETVNDVLTMLGGGGIGVAGNELIKKKGSTPSNESSQHTKSVSPVENPLYKDYANQLKTDLLHELAVTKKRQKALNSKINNIEFFLGKKYEDFDRKDTLH